MAQKAHRWRRIAMGVILGVLGLLFAAILILNLYVKIAFAPFYAESEQICPVPGLSIGFVPQDQDYYESEDMWVFSGYMADGSASPLFKRTSDGAESRCFVDLPDGSVYDGHGGGITSTDQYTFLTTKEGYTVIPTADVAAAGDGEHVKAVGDVKLEVAPAFINIDNDVLYAGDFYFPGPYETPEKEHLKTPDGSMNHAIMLAYDADPSGPYGFSTQADRVYSIPDCVQGVCQTPSDVIVLSTSVAVNPSRFLFYDPAQLKQTGTYQADGREAPLISLYEENLAQTVEAPPMAEGIEWLDGKIYFTDESASNKYIYGKFYGAGWLYAFEPPDIGA